MSEPAKVPLIPPRPNLGPEPLAVEARPIGPILVAIVLAGLAVVAILIRRRRRRKLASIGQGQAGGRLFAEPPPSPRERAIALSPSIRSALTRRFGAAYLARTTEELANDGRIADVLGRADFEDLIGILNAIDRLKFSAPGHAEDEGPDLAARLASWEPSVVQLTRALEARRGEAPK